MGMAGTMAVFVILGGFGISALPADGRHGHPVYQRQVPIRYSLGRGIGSMAYALTCVVLGLQVARWGGEHPPITHAGLVVLVISLVVPISLPRCARPAGAPAEN